MASTAEWHPHLPSVAEVAPLRAVAYCRVSTSEQCISLDEQHEATIAYCRARDWRVAASITETASGATLERRGLIEARAMLTAGDADVLVVTKLDRLTRSIRDFGDLVDAGVVVVSVRESIDLTTAAGRMMANVLTMFAQYEREVIGERTRVALAQLKAQGVRLGRPPVDVAPREVDAVADEYASCGSARGVSRALGIPRSRVQRILRAAG